MFHSCTLFLIAMARKGQILEGLFAKGNNSFRGALLEVCYENIPDIYYVLYE